MISYSLKHLSSIINAELIGDGDIEVNQVWFDSRNIPAQSSGIFFAIRGAQRDGNIYIKDVLEKGIQNFVVTEIPKGIEANFLLVNDVVEALQTWATYHRNQFNGLVIGITGTHGKTIVKEWLYHLLYREVNIIRSPKSYNSQIGVPLSVLEMDKSADISLIELGISQPKEMERIANIVNPEIAVLTMVGNAHSEFFEDRKEQIKEKTKLFNSAKKIIFPYEDEDIRNYVFDNFKDKEFVTFGRSENATIQLLSDLNNPNLTIKYQDKEYHIRIPLYDKASVYNVLVCFAIISKLEIDLDKIIPLFRTLQPVEMRLAQKEGINNTVIIDDTYNSDLSSIPIALNVLNNHIFSNKTLILTDVLQDRLDTKELYQKVAELVNAYPIQKVILIGKEIKEYKELFNNLYHSYTDTNEFLNNLNEAEFRDEVILLKGARTFELEKISKFFQEKSHDSVLEVDLGNLVENVRFFKSKLKPTTKMMTMVKASAYGLGGVEVTQALMNHNIDYFGVAYADEGAELRKNGVTQSIMVMNPEQSSYDKMIVNHLEPEVYSFRMLNNFTQALIRHKIDMAYPIHIKLNTGMNRLGFDEEQISELIQQLADNPYVKVKTVFSHFATSDMPEEEGFVHQQMATYNRMYDKLSFNLGYEPIRHICNSAAILKYPEYQMDMVRLGIGMYGILPDEENQKFLKNVATFKTVISQIHQLNEGDTVSYGRHFKAEKPTKIATLPVGYADGVKRILSNGKGKVSINGKLAEIVGNICMDMLMVNVTDIQCEEGDEVIVFGENPTVQQVAEWCDTISYEVLTSISTRVKRIYIQ